MNEVTTAKCQNRINTYYEFGRIYFGPFLLGFSRWLNNQVGKNKIDKLFFFARDGYMMEKAFKLVEKEEVDEKYVYFSRKSIRQALLHRCRDFEDSLKYISAEKYISFGGLLEYYGFDEVERIRLAEKYSLDLKQDFDMISLAINDQIKRVYYDLQDEINKRSIEQDELLLEYLKQIGIFGKVGIVDIGWKGSMQYYLETYLKEHSLNVELVGFYVGILPNKELSGNTYGFLYDEDDLRLRKKVLCFAGGLERLFQSLEGSTCGYKKVGGKIQPVLSIYEYEQSPEIQRYIIELQNGALKFVTENKNYGMSNKLLTYKLIQLGVKPTLKEIKIFSPFYNTDGSKEYYISQKPLYKYSFCEFRHALCNSTWKNGFMKSVFKVPFPYFWIYKLLKK